MKTMIRQILFLLLLLTPLAAQAQLGGRYNHRHPLVVVADSANYPYEYVDEMGNATGYHIEILETILDQMLIPHRFVLTSEYEARQAILHQEADLMLEIIPSGEVRPYPVSSTVLNYSRTEEEHLSSTDKVLLDIMDNQLFRMMQSGEAESMRVKWFSPDSQYNNASPLAVVFTLIILFITVAMTVVLNITMRRLRKTITRQRELNQLMSQTLTMGDFNVTQYDIQEQTITFLHGSIMPEGSTESMTTYTDRLRFDNEQEANKLLGELASGADGMRQLRAQWNAGTEDKPEWRDTLGHAVAEKDDDGHPTHIIWSITDITRLLREQRANDSLANKYNQTFEKSLVGQLLLSHDGHLLSANQEMRRIIHLDHPNVGKLLNMSFFDFDSFRDIYLRGSRNMLHCCCHLMREEIELDTYVEMRVNPVLNDHGDLIYYTVSMHDMTEERKLYMDLQKQEQQLQKMNDELSTYDDKLHYLLLNSNMYIWHSNLQERKIYYSRTLLYDEDSENFENFVNSMADDTRGTANDFITNIEEYNHSINVQCHFALTIHGNKDQWYNIMGMPTYDQDGRFNGHIGLMRNVTTIVNAQERLRQETLRAEDSGRQKSAFLANMTHEIRTPLNAIVGFSDILSTLTGTEEQQEFVNIIKQNCDMLLRLIDDILEASNMDSGDESITPVNVDFAKEFNDIAQQLSIRVTAPEVQYIIDNNPLEELRATQDMGRIRQLLTNFVTNSVKYTKQGHIRVGYQQQDGGLRIFCEDTGLGIPKENQEKVFERFYKVNDFVQGTGLGLSICRAIAERCGGRIGVDSEGENLGSTFWVWLPLNVKVDEEVQLMKS